MKTRFLGCFLTLLGLAVPAFSATFTVNSTLDTPDASPGNGACATAGAVCTLRAAIQESNALPGADTIGFNIGAAIGGGAVGRSAPSIQSAAYNPKTAKSGFYSLDYPSKGRRARWQTVAVGDLQTIAPGTALPSITGQVTIDGYTEPGASANTNGASLGSNAVLLIELDLTNAGSRSLTITADNSTVRGLIINSSPVSGVTIGGFGGNGAVAPGAGSVVEGCFIGTNSTGTAAGPGNSGGINVFASNVLIGGTTPAARNVISGNGTDVLIGFLGQPTIAPTNVRVQGNLIGTNAAGTAVIASPGVGVDIVDFGGNHTIGGTSPGARNVISGHSTGVLITSDQVNGPLGGNKVQGNFIGLNASGTAALPNLVGVLVSGQQKNNTIGGTATGAGNVISGNSDVNVRLGSALNNAVQGNFIGTNATGTAPPTGLPAGTFAPGVDAAAGNNTVGGTVAGAGNVIAFNSAAGVFVSDLNVQNVNIAGNSIFSNSRLGIDLFGKDASAGVTPNNSGPFGVGNRGQNFPVISSTANNVISGTLSSTANTAFRVEFFASNTTDASGFGEGQTFLGFQNVTTTAQGSAALSFASPIVFAGRFISATATDPAGNTSEFSGSVASVSDSCPTIVTNINDSGAGSLRSAVNCSNTTPGTQTISFNIPGAGVKTISPVDSYRLSDPVVIDGFTQPLARANSLAVGNNANMLIEISGANVPGSQGSLFSVQDTAGGTTLRGMVLNRGFGTVQILSGNNVVEGCFFNINPAGTAALLRPNGQPGGGIFIVLGDGNRIGGTVPAARNVIVADSACISIGNTFPKPLNTRVQGNYIGTNAQGTAALNSAGFIGINILDSSDTLIGGLTPTPGTGAGNLISGNGPSNGGFAGILIADSFFGPAGLAPVTIQGNLIGTNATGTAAIPNTKFGIVVQGTRGRVLIGGPQAGARNVISGNGTQSFADAAIRVVAEASLVTVQNNFIGTAINGTTPLPNIGDGIRTESSASSPTFIGGAGVGEGNIIANNTAQGVFISANLNTFTGKSTILGNSIFNNGGIGINLGLGVSGPAITINDPTDTDGGVNGLQNFPVFRFVTTLGGSTRAMGDLNSLPNKTYRLEFFGSRAADPSGFGEGQTFLGTQNVTTNQFGAASFEVTFPNATGPFITATATDPDGNTSEFSAAFLAATLTPQSATNPVGTPHTVTLTLLNNNLPQVGTTVNFSASGVNSATGTGTTNAQGQATFTYTGQNAGTDNIIGFGTVSNLSFSAVASKIWTGATAVPTLSISDVTLAEASSESINAVFTVTLSALSTSPVRVNFATANGTALAGSDYIATSGQLIIASGQRTAQILVPVLGDSLVENNETFFVNLTGPSGATLADAQALGTITDNDTATLSVADLRVAEGNTGSRSVNVVATLSTPSLTPETFNFSTANGTATAGSDYTAVTGSFTIAAGATSANIPVTIIGDTTVETDETFAVTVSPQQPTDRQARAVIGDAQATVTILNDDAVALPTLSIGDVRLTEGNAGTSNAVFTVTLSANSATPVTVRFATTNGTALSPGDFVAQSGTLTIPAGTRTATISVAVVGETAVEPDENFTLVLSQPVGATIADGSGQGTIANDDVVSSGLTTVTGQLLITIGKLTPIGPYLPGLFGGGGTQFAQNIVVKNNGAALSGPVSFILDGLPTNVTLSNATGKTVALSPTGRYFLNIPLGSDTILSAGESASFTLNFKTSRPMSFSFTPNVVAGVGTR